MLTRADLHRIVDELSDEELAEVAAFVTQKRTPIGNAAETALDPRTLYGIDDEHYGLGKALDDLAAGRTTTNRIALEMIAESQVEQPMTWKAFIELMAELPKLDDQWADDVEEIHKAQGTAEPFEWPS